VYVSSDGGATFHNTTVLGSALTSNGIAVNTLGKAGELWLSADKGLWHSTDYGKTVHQLSGGLTEAWSIAAGASSLPGGTPSIFAAAEISGVFGIFRSDDNGFAWSKISNAQFGFGSTSGAILAADPRIYKRVYIGTNGRGIFYGN